MIDKKRLTVYLAITFLITWGCWWADGILVKMTALTASDLLPMILFTLGGFGPTIAAVVCMDGGFSKKGLRQLLFRNTKKNWAVMLAAVALETGWFFLCSNGLNEMIPRNPVGIIVVGIVFLQAAVLYGGNEELGWRGTMQPILEKGMPAPAATFLVAAVWVCWHIPLWYIEGDSHQSMSFFSFAITGFALSYWLAAIYDITGAVVFCMILHGWTNTLMGVVDIKQDAVYYLGIGVLTLLAAAVSVHRANRRKG